MSMIKTIALVTGLAIVPIGAFGQSTQPPVNAPNNNQPTSAAPTPVPGGASMPATPMTGVNKDPAGGGAAGAPVIPPANPGGTIPAQPAPVGTPNPAAGGSSSTKP
jgi:hypothetical protein